MLSSPHNVECCYDLIINGTNYTQLHTLSHTFLFPGVLTCHNHLPLYRYYVLQLISPRQHCIREIHSGSLLKSAVYPPIEELCRLTIHLLFYSPYTQLWMWVSLRPMLLWWKQLGVPALSSLLWDNWILASQWVCRWCHKTELPLVSYN